MKHALDPARMAALIVMHDAAVAASLFFHSIKMDVDYSLENSVLTLLLRNGFYCGAFNGFLVFGAVTNRKFSRLKSFVFQRKEYYLFFITFLQVAKAINGQSDINKQIFLKKSNLEYQWQILSREENAEKISLAIIIEEKKTFEIEFTLSEMNEFILTIARLISLTLNLKLDENKLLDLASMQDMKVIESFKNEEKCKAFIVNHFQENTNYDIKAYCILLMHYRDIILLLHKLKSIICVEEEDEFFRLISD